MGTEVDLHRITGSGAIVHSGDFRAITDHFKELEEMIWNVFNLKKGGLRRQLCLS